MVRGYTGKPRPNVRRALTRLASGIGAKIILPYLMLTLIVAGVGAYIVTSLVTGTLRERLDNQLVDAGRVVAENLVMLEEERLEVLRLISFTDGVASALSISDHDALAAIVPQIAVNSSAGAVVLVDRNGYEIFGWRPGSNLDRDVLSSGADYSHVEDVQMVLDGHVDNFGAKRAAIVDAGSGPLLYSIGPIEQNGELVGAVMVGTKVRELVARLTENAVARVTLYDRSGTVVDTTLGIDHSADSQILQESPQLHTAVTTALQETTDRVEVVSATSHLSVPFREVKILNQDYQLAFGDWRMRGVSFGLFSVALPVNFIVNAVVTSRGLLSLIFSLASLAVITLGYFLSQIITRPLGKLVQTSKAVAQGRLDQRTGIKRRDEIGELANSFDIMTANLSIRNQQLAEQAGELEAILHSIADAVLVFDAQDQIVTYNPAAQALLPHLIPHVSGKSENGASGNGKKRDGIDIEVLLGLSATHGPERYDIGGRVFSGLSAPIATEEGSGSGRVVVLRDVTREAEVEELKDGFITSVSHELRTPLTSIKGFVDLLIVSGSKDLSEQNMRFARVISENTDKMVQHVDKLIDIAEIQNRTLQLRLQHAPFARLVEESASAWTDRMKSKGIKLKLNISNDLLWVHADTVRLVWAIDNLMRNAHDYTVGEGVVTVHVFREGGNARLDIVDTGIGIAPADQPFLFSRFFRVQNVDSHDVPGIGLDLFIARSLVEANGGRIWFESEPGVGSTFSIALPLAEQSEPVVQA